MAYAAGDTSITLPEPVTREEKYLYAIALNRGGGGGGGTGTGNVYCPDYDTILVMDKATYDALPVKNLRTKYEIKG